MDERNLMQEMREKYYPYHEQSRNLTEALDIIKEDMEKGKPFSEFWTYWTDLPDDWVCPICKMAKSNFIKKE